MRRLDLKSLFLINYSHFIIRDYNDSFLPDYKLGLGDDSSDIYVFDSYDEYVDYYRHFLNKIDKTVFEHAIFTVGSKGHVIAFKDLCEHIIIKMRTKEFYENFDQQKIDDIHSRGKLTPMDKVEECEEMDLCAPGDHMGSGRQRCHFYQDCHLCLLEYFSHNDEYEELDLKLTEDVGIARTKKNNT